MRADGSLQSIFALGHSSIETTRIYLISTGVEHQWQLEQMRLVS